MNSKQFDELTLKAEWARAKAEQIREQGMHAQCICPVRLDHPPSSHPHARHCPRFIYEHIAKQFDLDAANYIEQL